MASPLTVSCVSPDGDKIKKRGALIVIEGLDRTGKSTQALRLTEALQVHFGKPAEYWRFPDRTTPLGKIINEYLTNKADLDDHVIHLLFSANRWEKRSEMLKKLREGTTLVVDRYAFSGVAFSSAKPGLSTEWCRQPDIGLPKPDLVCFLSLDMNTLRRRSGYGNERYENDEFQQMVFKRFLELEDPTWVRIDAAGSTEEIADSLLRIVQERTQQLSSDVGRLWESASD